MNNRIYFVLGGALVLLILALGLVGRARQDAQAIVDRAFPAVRALGDLRELIAQVQISLLERQHDPILNNGPEAKDKLSVDLVQAGEILKYHKSTVMSARGAELCDRVEKAYAVYCSAATAAFAATAGDENRVSLHQGLVTSYHDLQRELAVLREYRLGRAETRIADVEKGVRRTQLTNLVAMGSLLALIFLTWFGSRVTAHDRH